MGQVDVKKIYNETFISEQLTIKFGNVDDHISVPESHFYKLTTMDSKVAISRKVVLSISSIPNALEYAG